MSFGCQQLALELSGALRPISTQLLSDLLGPLLLQHPIGRKVLKWQSVPHQANYFFSQDQHCIFERAETSESREHPAFWGREAKAIFVPLKRNRRLVKTLEAEP